jgi:nitroreductase
MELTEALRTTGAVREFDDTPVDDDVIESILDTARFAPSGGNRQAWRVIVVRDQRTRERIRDLYLTGWYDYQAQVQAGLVAWAAVGDREAEAAALVRAPEIAEAARRGPGGFAEHLERVPVLLAVIADLRRVAAMDRDFPRYGMVGGASIYPFVWGILLAARGAGLGGVITTTLTRSEVEVRQLLGVPDHFALAAVVALGHPRRRPTSLRRRPVQRFATLDRFDGPPLNAAGGTWQE